MLENCDWKIAKILKLFSQPVYPPSPSLWNIGFFFFYIQAIFHIRSSMLQRRINSVKLRILTGNDFKCHRNKIAWFGSLCNSIKVEIFNCTRTQRIKRSSIYPTIITRKVAHFEGRIVQRQLENNIFFACYCIYLLQHRKAVRLWWWNIIHFVADLFR